MHKKLFCLTIQVKQSIIEAIPDPGSQKNLISENLFQKLGLQTKPHPCPCPLSKIQINVQLKIIKQCTFKFAIIER